MTWPWSQCEEAAGRGLEPTALSSLLLSSHCHRRQPVLRQHPRDGRLQALYLVEALLVLLHPHHCGGKGRARPDPGVARGQRETSGAKGRWKSPRPLFPRAIRMSGSFATCVNRFDSNNLTFQSLFQSQESDLKENYFYKKIY